MCDDCKRPGHAGWIVEREGSRTQFAAPPRADAEDAGTERRFRWARQPLKLFVVGAALFMVWAEIFQGLALALLLVLFVADVAFAAAEIVCEMDLGEDDDG